MTFFKKEHSLFTWDGVDGFKIYESFSDSDKLLKIWFSLFKMFKKEDLNSENSRFAITRVIVLESSYLFLTEGMYTSGYIT
jgi:hypothetical protein